MKERIALLLAVKLKRVIACAKLIARLDSELESNGNTRVFYLKYSKAEDLVDVLKGVSESIKAEESASKN